MSSRSHKRNWRPEGGRRRKSSRKQKIGGLIIALVLLVLMSLYFLWPAPATPVQFVSIVETGYGDFSTNSAAAGDARRLQTIFEGLHTNSNARVRKPLESDLSNLQLAEVQAGDTLIVYCSAHAVPTDSNGEPRLELVDSANDKRVPLRDVLDSLEKTSPRQTILLLDVSQTRPGLTNGVLANDSLTMLRELLEHTPSEGSADEQPGSKSAEASPYPKLTVICSADAGQRNWPVRSTGVGGATPDETPSGEPNKNASVTFAGTVFGNAVASAFATRNAQTLGELEKYLQQQMGSQKLVRLGGSRLRADAKILTSVSFKEETPSAEETLSGTAESPETPASDTAAATAATSQPSSDEKLAALWTVRDDLREQGTAAVVAYPDWMAVQVLLLHAQEALRYGDSAAFQKFHDEAEGKLTAIQETIANARSKQLPPELLEWVLMPLPAAEPPAANSTARPLDPRRLFQQVAGAEPNDRLLDADDYLQNLQHRRDLVTWLVTVKLKDLAAAFDQLPAEERSREVDELRNFLSTLDRAGIWNRDRADHWPHELVLLQDLLPVASQSGTSLKLLHRLLETRRSALLLAVGFSSDGQNLRRSAWQTVEPAVRQVLLKTTAAERWLAVGEEGLKLAEKHLREAEQTLNRIQADVITAQSVAAVADARRAELPALVETLARRQERVPVARNDGILASAREMASRVSTSGRVDTARFPPAVLSGNLQDAVFRELLILTEPADADAAADARQVGRFDQLRGLIADRVRAAGRSSVPAVECLDLLDIPWLESSDRKALEQALLTATTAGEPSDSAGQGTGLWLSFWSIRTLAALGLNESSETELWNQWAALATALNDDSASEDAGRNSLLQRVRLGDALRSHWKKMLGQQAPGGSSLLTAADDVVPLIAEDLKRHAPFSPLYAQRFRQLSPDRLTGRTNVLGSVEETQVASASGTVTIPVGPLDAGESLYVFSDQLRVSGTRDGDWTQTVADTAGGLQLTSGGSGRLTQAGSVVIARVDPNGIVLETARLMVFPPVNTEDWDIVVYSASSEVASRRASNGKRIELIPHTEADAPLALTVRLRRPINDITPRARVEILRLLEDGTSQKIGTVREVVFEEGARETEIPLLPAAAADAPPPAEGAAPPSFDISGGMKFLVTPLHQAVSPKAIELNLFPYLYEADQFVETPQPDFDLRSLTLTIPLILNERKDKDALRPKKIPVDVYFNPALERLVSGGTRHLDDLENNENLVVSFNRDIEQAMKSRDAGLEFGLSVAGVPAAWRWELDGSARPERLQGRPTVHAELELLNREEVRVQWLSDRLLLGDDWKKARFASRFEVHGSGLTSGDSANYRISVDVVRDGRPVAQYTDLKLNGPRITRTLVEPGEAGQWKFTTDTVLAQIASMDFEQRGLSAGRYDLRATLTRVGDRQQSTSDIVRFIFDDTKPEDPEIGGTTGPHNVKDRLRIPVTAHDPESGIVRIEYGFDPAHLKTTIGSSQFERVSSELVFSAEELGALVTQPGSQFVKLTVRATNRVGLTSESTQRIQLVRDAPPEKDMTPAEKKPGAIIVEFGATAAMEITLEGPTPGTDKKPVGAGKSVTFSKLEPGDYKLSFKNTTRAGKDPPSQTVTVGSGQKRTVTVD